MRVVLITGAGRGIGAAVARAFAAEGDRVALLDADADAVAQTADTLRAAGARAGDVLALPADVTDAVQVRDAVERTESGLGPIGVLANVAGVLRPAPVLELDPADWERTFAVNATGVFLASREVARRMVPRRAGVIVTVASNAAGIPRTGMAAYAASKAAATHFTRCLGLELAPHGIRCNVVQPGSTDTGMQRALLADPRIAIDGDGGTYRTGIPLGRIAAPEDIADAVAFLASDRARHITMHDLYVDGGATLRA